MILFSSTAANIIIILIMCKRAFLFGLLFSSFVDVDVRLLARINAKSYYLQNGIQLSGDIGNDFSKYQSDDSFRLLKTHKQTNKQT